MFLHFTRLFVAARMADAVRDGAKIGVTLWRVNTKVAGNQQKQAQKTPDDQSGFLNNFFQLSQRGSTVSREVRGGLVTFITMAYILILNPAILSANTEGTDITIAAIATGTALVAGILSILMGVFASFPPAQALLLAGGHCQMRILEPRLERGPKHHSQRNSQRDNKDTGGKVAFFRISHG